MDPVTHHPDPLAEAFGRGSQRAAQLASIVMAAACACTRYRARREQLAAARGERSARALRDQQRAAYQQARTAWAPAHDPRWLAQADLIQGARAWGAAAPFAGDDPLAASAVRKCEDRLRRLHPYGMARYDRLRADGAGPIEAMRESAPLFTRRPDARPGEPAVSRPVVEASVGLSASGPRSGGAGPAAGPLAGEPAAAGERSPAQVAAESFPYTAAEVVAAGASTGVAARPTLSTVARQIHRPGRTV